MKKIVSGDCLQEKMKDAIDLLCDTVKCTLGPKGSNVIIDHSSFSPFITNDGVTIAQNIQSEDEVINVVLELAKESSIKTNEQVGDGTTTTLVLLQIIFNLCLKYIKTGISSILLKKQLNEYLNKILDLLEEEKIPLSLDMVKNIARISSNDSDIADVVSEVFCKVSSKDAISVKEVEENLIDVIYYKGYSFQSVLPSSLLLLDKTSIKYDDSLFLVVDDVLSDIENISDMLNDVMKSMKPLVIVAKDFTDFFVNNIVSLVLDGNLKCILLKVNEYGIRHRVVLKDLEKLSGSKIVNQESNVSTFNFGVVKSVFVNNEETRIDFNLDSNLENYILQINEELKSVSDDYLKEFYNKRLSMFNGYTACVLIGANTKTELREKRMRLDDAICAVYSSKDGVLLGGGIALLKVSNKISGESEVEKIWKCALRMPFQQLMINSGLDCESIEAKLVDLNYNSVFNLYNEEYETIDETIVMDSYNVIVNSLLSACSIATMLITTNSLVINEQLNNLNKINDYGNI